MRRGQIQFGESIMVVIVIVFLLIIGLVFYFNHTRAAFKAEASTIDDVEALKLGKSLLAIPEIQCSSLDGGTTCVDGLKLVVWQQLLAEEPSDGYYHRLFGRASITLRLVTGGEEEIPLYANIPPAVSVREQTIFLTVHDPRTGEERFGYLLVKSAGEALG